MSMKKGLLSLVLTFAMVLTTVPWAGIGASAAYTGALQFDANGKFTVMQVADIQDDQSVDSAVISALTNNIARYHPDLVVFTGDNIKESISSVSNFQSSVNGFLAPLIATNTKFAITFGNHDSDGSGGSLSSQYAYYGTKGGSLFIDHDVAALTGDASGVIPIFANGQSSGTPAYNVYVMDSGHSPSSGSYDACYTSQVDYYIQNSLANPGVPSIWFQHVIVPDIYTRCMTTTSNGTTGQSGKGSPFSSNTYYINAARINLERTYLNSISASYKEGPCPANQSVYEAAAHRSSSTYGSKTLYEAWRDYGPLKGAYFGHDHVNKFTCTTSDGIDLGYGKGTTMYKNIISYNDGDPGCSIYQLDIDGSYTTEYSANTDLANKVLVAYDANGGLGTVKEKLFAKNSSVTLTPNAFAKTGYIFTGWNTAADGSGTARANGATYTLGTTDTTLYAQWVPDVTYNITFNANGGTGGTGPTAMIPGEVLTAPAVAKTGYTLSGWSPTLPSVVPSTDTTYTAQWSANTYTVSYNGNGSTSGNTAQSSHTYDVPSNLTTNGFSKTGNTFLGWSTSSTATSAAYTDSQNVLNLTSSPNGVVTFYSVWATNQYTVTFNSNGGTSVATLTKTYNTAAAKPSDPTKTGNTFSGWYSDSGLTAAVSWPYTIPAYNVDFYAKWDVNSYTIAFNANEGIGGTSASMNFGATLTAPSVARTGYSLQGWSPDVPTTVPAADTTYTAQWSVNSYLITFDANEGTGGGGETMDYGEPLAAPTVSRQGYEFAGWLPTVPSTVPAENKTFTAQWTPINYTITFDAAGGTGGTSGLIPCGTELVAPTVTKVGYTFMGWDPEVPQTVPAVNSTYTAQWLPEGNNLIFAPNGGTGGTGTMLSFGSQIISPVMLRPGYLFTGWSPALPSTVVSGINTYQAQWVISGFMVTFDATGGTGGTSGLYQFGTHITTPAVTKAGYTFTGWSPIVPSSVPGQNTTYTAQWSRNKVQITFDANGGVGGTSSLMTFGNDLILPTVTKPGYIFTGWSPAVPSKVVAGNQTYTAQWMAVN